MRSGRNITLGAVHARLDIVDQPSLLSYENTYRVNVGLWNNKNTTISAELRGSRQISEDPAYMNVGKGLSILSTYNPPATAWVLDAALSFNEKQWRKRSGIFDNVRHDLEWIASAGIRNSNVSYFGFTPTLRYTYQNRKSTVSLNTIQSHDLFFGISNAF